MMGMGTHGKTNGPTRIGGEEKGGMGCKVQMVPSERWRGKRGKGRRPSAPRIGREGNLIYPGRRWPGRVNWTAEDYEVAGKYLVHTGGVTHTLNGRIWDGRGDPRETQWTDPRWWKGREWEGMW